MDGERKPVNSKLSVRLDDDDDDDDNDDIQYWIR